MTGDIPLSWFVGLASAIFAIGLFGVLVRRNLIAVLMAIELMLNASAINLVAYWRYGHGSDSGDTTRGVVFALFVLTIAAAEVAVGVGLILHCYRRGRDSGMDRYDELKG